MQRKVLTLLLTVLVIAIPSPMLSPISPVHALPEFSRTIGLVFIDGSWRYGDDTALNPTIAIYRNIAVTLFLKSSDGASHRLRINTPTPVISPLIPASGEIVILRLRPDALPPGVFTYCDTFVLACGIFQVKIQGDVDGDNLVEIVDLALVGSRFGSSLADWNPADEPYRDGRVDHTDLLVVQLYLGTFSPWPAPYDPDINEDGRVDVVDLAVVGGSLGKTARAPFDDPNQGPDLNHDNLIDIVDLASVGSKFGCTIVTCP